MFGMMRFRTLKLLPVSLLRNVAMLPLGRKSAIAEVRSSGVQLMMTPPGLTMIVSVVPLVLVRLNPVPAAVPRNAWADATLGYLNRISCADPLTGLDSQSHLVALLAAPSDDALVMVVVREGGTQTIRIEPPQ